MTEGIGYFHDNIHRSKGGCERDADNNASGTQGTYNAAHDEIDSASAARFVVVVVVPGDLNGDGKPTAADAAIALKMAVRGEYDHAADVSDDGSVTALDALMILQAAAGGIEVG